MVRVIVADLPRHIQPVTSVTTSTDWFTQTPIEVAWQASATPAPGVHSWFGRVSGDPRSSVVITSVDGVVTGGLWTGGRAYELVPAIGEAEPSGAWCISRELPPDQIVRCYGTTHRTAEISHVDQPLPEFSSPTPAQPAIGPRGSTCPCNDDARTIDVLCLYTPAARDAAGGIAALQSRVQNGLDTATFAIANSGIDATTMRMAAFVEVAYDEVAPAWGDHLPRITNPSDGFIDNAHTLRDQYAADLVALFIDDTRFTGGQAYYATFWPQSAFSVNNWRSVGGGSLTLAHELGHNFGCAHDRPNADNGVFYYGFGHHFNPGGGELGTIMSYVGSAIPFYSNPHLTHISGQPLGVAFGQPLPTANALVISRSRYALANFRDAVGLQDCNGNGIEDSVDIANSTSTDANADCRPDECERRVYVDANATTVGDGRSWTAARRDLWEVLYETRVACSDVTEIWVADGTYLPTGTDRFARFAMRSGLRLLGGFQGQSRPGGGETSATQRDPALHETRLSGDLGVPLDSSDNAHSVVEAVGVDAAALLDGFVIQDGGSDFAAAGMWCINSQITLRNCVFRDNTATFDGGAIYVDGGLPRIQDCRFERNSAGGSGGAIAVNYNGLLHVRDCSFEENFAGFGGAAINFFQTGGDIVASSFALGSARWGGGIALDQASVRLDGCHFSDNEATFDGSGAIDVWISTLVLSNSILRDNTAATSGGAIYVQNSTTARITNCTIVANFALDRGGGLATWGSTLNLRNSILWENSDAFEDPQQAQLTLFSGIASLAHNCLQGWTGSLGGSGNFGTDPLFVELASRDLSLAAASLCIDSGNNSFTSADTLDRDADGNVLEAWPLDALDDARFVDDAAANTGVIDPARPTLALIDRGALERQSPPCPGDVNGDGAVNLSDLATLLANFGTASGATRAQGDLDNDGDVDLSDLASLLAQFGTVCG
ncbi:MAG: right-handed parallel beta-helix repeat-containing protein [Phycisphaerae bacterium]